MNPGPPRLGGRREIGGARLARRRVGVCEAEGETGEGGTAHRDQGPRDALLAKGVPGVEVGIGIDLARPGGEEGRGGSVQRDLGPVTDQGNVDGGVGLSPVDSRGPATQEGCQETGRRFGPVCRSTPPGYPSPMLCILLFVLALGCPTTPSTKPVDTGDSHPSCPAETCNGLDDDCDGVVDEDALDAPAWHPDADGDNFGDPATTVEACAAPEGYVPDATDCAHQQPGNTGRGKRRLPRYLPGQDDLLQ